MFWKKIVDISESKKSVFVLQQKLKKKKLPSERSVQKGRRRNCIAVSVGTITEILLKYCSFCLQQKLLCSILQYKSETMSVML